jgi:hypothetical protein
MHTPPTHLYPGNAVHEAIAIPSGYLYLRHFGR